MRRLVSLLLITNLVSINLAVADEALPIIDVHIHYSHDAWQMLPPKKAVGILREAGLKRAFVSSSSDDGTQNLYSAAPDLIVPVLRPYRRRGELSSWMHDETVLDMLKERLSKFRYAGIGEFHAFGDDIELPVLQGVIDLAEEYGLFLHAHSDTDAVERIFAHSPSMRVLWAHSGFEDPDTIHKMLEKYPNLWADLAFRSEHANYNQVDPRWRKLFDAFPNRIMLGTDTYTPERWFYVVDNALANRSWLDTLPRELAENLAWKDADQLLLNTSFNACNETENESMVAIHSETNDLRLQLHIPKPTVGEPFSMQVAICDDNRATTDELYIDAIMPAHGHGMNYLPDVSASAPGVFQIDGMLFHMPGDWKINIELRDSEQRYELSHQVSIR
jgi:hypothetical protein